jgi:hypothetical protein
MRHACDRASPLLSPQAWLVDRSGEVRTGPFPLVRRLPIPGGATVFLESPMPHDPACRADVLTTATVLLVQVGVLRRYLHRHEDLPPHVVARLETGLEAVMQSAQDLTQLAVDVGAPSVGQAREGIPTTHLERLARVSRN